MNDVTRTQTAPVFDVTVDNFEQDVVARSRNVPVLIDFWASWCGPCKALGPVLDKLAEAYHGAFAVAKVDVDAEQALAGHFQVRSIPTVMLVKDGQIVDGFAGALPESGVRKFLDKHGIEPLGEPAPAEPVAPQDPAEAVARLRAAAEAAPEEPERKLELALALVASGEYAEASALIEALPANLGVDPRTQRARAQIAFGQVVQEAPPRDALEQAVAKNPDDLTARHQLGARLLLDGEDAAALDQFMEMLTRDRQFHDGLPRRALVDAFTLIDDQALVRGYRRRMTALLF